MYSAVYMANNVEAQLEEREVLASIYEADQCFKEVSANTFSYRIGEQGEPKTFLVEVKWGENYPDNIPDISLGSFYNNHLPQECKAAIIEALRQEAEQLLCTPMTYSLFQHAVEHGEELVTCTPQLKGTPSQHSTLPTELEVGRKREKKEVLSKRAKRRMADRTNAQGERPRGWDWVDIVKLSKSGSQPT